MNSIEIFLFLILRTFIGQTPAFLGPRKQSWSLKAGILITSISSLVIMISLLVYLNQNPKVEPKKLKDSTKIDNFHDLYKVRNTFCLSMQFFFTNFAGVFLH